jgi:hypothetical protein
VKIQITILFFFICILNLHASTPNKTDDSLKDNINATVTTNQGGQSGALTITSSDNTIPTLKGSLNSILGYSIFIFFSVLIIILIDNRNLEKRYKKLVADFKNKDPLI